MYHICLNLIINCRWLISWFILSIIQNKNIVFGSMVIPKKPFNITNIVNVLKIKHTTLISSRLWHEYWHRVLSLIPTNIMSEELLSRTTFNFLFIFVKKYCHSDKDNSVHNIGDIAAGCCAVGQNMVITVYNIFVWLRYAMLDQVSKLLIRIFIQIQGIINQYCTTGRQISYLKKD